ncbi:hypothetical protein EON09_01105 [Pseudomonas soli]|jgi:hypothetical protein|uniref:Lipoprotein n=2 Tax=cellular organisms TaxID=131567 RepID=A0A1H9KUD2_9PSED|nr:MULTISPECIES: hypothetical protein [Pseudomonas]AUY36683.1 hypothetical protein C3F42_27275 [Pseudomonas sp. PONIH3]MCX5507017.1 hypothetical protein [Pseudomonas sp. BJa3]MEE1879857.1 hypothetical protein [Pseudomonas soli]NBK37120.1 hypothetical protein [Pseudomonas soli]WJO20182.1 hypothetical protein LU688_18010 [Pseudomonas soli]
MNPTLPILGLGLVLALPLQAASLAPPLLAANDSNNPYNSPIMRANPNSRQGSVPAMPPVRGPSTQPNPRPPTLDNRGIGNGENLRREQQTPNLEPTRPPRDSPRAP